MNPKESSQVEDELVYYTQQTEEFIRLSKWDRSDFKPSVLYLNKTINAEFFPICTL